MQNGIGDESSINLPEDVKIDENLLKREKAMAKFIQSEEGKLFREHLEQRMEHYKTQLPNGDEVSKAGDFAERGLSWTVANYIIAELKYILMVYDNAVESVKNAELQ